LTPSWLVVSVPVSCVVGKVPVIFSAVVAK
jgi:hypothetical protein